MGALRYTANSRTVYSTPNYEWHQGAHTVIQIVDRHAASTWHSLLSAETTNDPATATARFGVLYTSANRLSCDNTTSGSTTGAATAWDFFDTVSGDEIIYFQGYRKAAGNVTPEFFRALFNVTTGTWGTLSFKAGDAAFSTATNAVGASGVLVFGELDGGDDANADIYLQAIIGAELSQAAITTIFNAKTTASILAATPGFCVDANDDLTNDLSGSGRNRSSTANTSSVTPPVGLWAFGAGGTDATVIAVPAVANADAPAGATPITQITTDREGTGDPTGVGVGGQYQRGTFTAAGRDWLIYADKGGLSDTSLFYTSSADGLATWRTPTAFRSLADYAADDAEGYTDYHFDGTYLHYAVGGTSDGGGESLYYRRGTPNSDGTITWSAAEQTVYTGTSSVLEVGIETDSNGVPWISYEDYSAGINGFPLPYVTRATAADGTWTTQTGYPLVLLADAEAKWWTGVTRLNNSGSMLVLAWHDNEDLLAGFPAWGHFPGGTEPDWTILTRVINGAGTVGSPVYADDGADKRLEVTGLGFITNIAYASDPAMGRAWAVWSDNTGGGNGGKIWSSEDDTVDYFSALDMETCAAGVDTSTGELVIVYTNSSSDSSVRMRRFDPAARTLSSESVIASGAGVVRASALQITERGTRLVVAYQTAETGRDVIRFVGLDATPAAPVVALEPQLTGVAQVGETLSCSTGVWTGFPIPTYSYAWVRSIDGASLGVWPSGAGTEWEYIPGATSSTYELTSDELGEYILCAVTATNSQGSATEGSTEAGQVTAGAADATVTAVPAAALADAPAAAVVAGSTVAGVISDALADAPVGGTVVTAHATVAAVPAVAAAAAALASVTGAGSATVAGVPAVALASAPPANQQISAVVNAPAVVALASAPIAVVATGADATVAGVPAFALADAPLGAIGADATVAGVPSVAAGDAPLAALTASALVTAVISLARTEAPRPSISPTPAGGGTAGTLTTTFAEGSR